MAFPMPYENVSTAIPSLGFNVAFVVFLWIFQNIVRSYIVTDTDVTVKIMIPYLLCRVCYSFTDILILLRWIYFLKYT